MPNANAARQDDPQTSEGVIAALLGKTDVQEVTALALCGLVHIDAA